MTTLTQTRRGLLPLMVVQVKLFLREPVATFFTIAFAPLLLLLFGVIYGNEPTEVFGGRGSMDVTVPAYIGIVIVTVALIGIPIQTATNRELGVLRRYRVTPLRPLSYLIADVTAYYLMTLTGTVLLIVVGAVAFGVRPSGSVPAILAGFTLSALAFFALGYLLASRRLDRTGRPNHRDGPGLPDDVPVRRLTPTRTAATRTSPRHRPHPADLRRQTHARTVVRRTLGQPPPRRRRAQRHPHHRHHPVRPLLPLAVANPGAPSINAPRCRSSAGHPAFALACLGVWPNIEGVATVA